VVERVFRVVSNSKEHLSSDIIALALLKQITLNAKEPNVFFGVEELSQIEEKQYSNEYSILEENN